MIEGVQSSESSGSFENDRGWNEIRRLLIDKHCGRNEHPKVAALIYNPGNQEQNKGDDNLCNNVFLCETHKEVKEYSFCYHAEEKLIEKFLSKDNFGNILIGHDHQLILYTSLEPCNERSRFKVACAHRIATISHLLQKVKIGSLDPDPFVFGRGILYLIRNVGIEKIEFAPPEYRCAFRELNKEYYDYIKKKYSQYVNLHFIVHELGNEVQKSTNFNNSSYLTMSYSLARWYQGDTLLWINPKFPSFKDILKFHAWWAQGVLENDMIKNIILYVHENDWNQGILWAEKSGNLDCIKKEFEFAKTNAQKTVNIIIHNENIKGSMAIFANIGQEITSNGSPNGIADIIWKNTEIILVPHYDELLFNGDSEDPIFLTNFTVFTKSSFVREVRELLKRSGKKNVEDYFKETVQHVIGAMRENKKEITELFVIKNS